MRVRALLSTVSEELKLGIMTGAELLRLTMADLCKLGTILG